MDSKPATYDPNILNKLDAIDSVVQLLKTTKARRTKYRSVGEILPGQLKDAHQVLKRRANTLTNSNEKVEMRRSVMHKSMSKQLINFLKFISNIKKKLIF